MPKLMGTTDQDVYKTLSNFQFSAVEMDRLGGTEYTIVQLLVDVSSSVDHFKKELEDCVKTVFTSCKKSPRSENLLFRVATFASAGGRDNIEEVHGFNLLSSMDESDYNGILRPNGMTPLYDATLNAVESLATYGKTLVDQDYFCNGILFVITDGLENASRNVNSPGAINTAMENMRRDEVLESMKAILIAIDHGDQYVKDELQNFNGAAGFDEYIEIGTATAGKLAKLAQWVSQSISSTSQALGTGGPSQPVSFSL